MILRPLVGFFRKALVTSIVAGSVGFAPPGHALPPEQVIVWQPQAGPQTALLQCPIFEVFYGGARGGGKTDGMIGDWLQHSQLYGEHAIGIFVRRNRTQLSEVIARTKQIFNKFLTPDGKPAAKFNEQKSEWVMPGGARLRFVYLERLADAENYQGHSYTRVYIEEVTNFPSPKPIDLLRATLRSALGVPVGMRLTGNPGGPGHGWVKQRYIDPAPLGYTPLVFTDSVVMPDGSTVEVSLERVFIPSKLKDNPLLLTNQPTYVLQLKQTGSEQLVKAWLEGDWNSIEGAYFSDMDDSVHVLPASLAREFPRHWTRFRAMDWGSAKPFCVGWYAVADGKSGPDIDLPERVVPIQGGQHRVIPAYHGKFPEGAVIKYREWYGWNGKVNEGCKMSVESVGEGIRAYDRSDEMEGLTIAYGLADPSMFIQNGGPSLAEKMASVACPWIPADNKRIPGWEQIHIRFQDDVPTLYFLDCCSHTIRTLPELQHDDTNPEDLNTEGEDHAADETRYAVMSRPLVRTGKTDRPDFRPPKLPHELTFNDLVALNRKRRLAQGERLMH